MDCFLVDHLDVERLLAEWHWLCPGPMKLVARTAFADLFLRDQAGHIFHLDVGLGKLTNVADSEAHFVELTGTAEKRERWFAESDEQAVAARGLKPDLNQCIGLTIPIVFAESVSPNTAYVTDIYDHVSFLGQIHRQITDLPDGTKIRLKVTD